MSDHEAPRLCGGTFFTLTLQALKQRMGAREHYNSESDGMSDPEVLMGLFKVINPDFQDMDKKKLKGVTDGFKSCKSKTSIYLPFGDTPEIHAFDQRVRKDYDDVLRSMKAFTDTFIDTGEAVKKHVTLVRALADLVLQDDLIRPPQDGFYISPDGRITRKADFATLDNVYLPAFLLGVWHYAVAVRTDNRIGQDTYDRWCPPAGGSHRIYQGNMGEGILDGIRVITKTDDPPLMNLPEHTEEDEPVFTEIPAPQQPSFQQTGNIPFGFNFTQIGNNNTQIGHIEHYYAGKKKE